MNNLAPEKLSKEKQTIKFMIEDYCNSHHNTKEELCEDCKTLLEYANLRINKCPFGEQKTNCADCKVHCYKPEMREKVKEVMKFSGPRMVFKHPVLAAQHIANALKNKNIKE